MSGPLAVHAEGYGIDLEVSDRPSESPQCTGPSSFRGEGGVERTFAWLNRYRRLVPGLERLARTVEASIYLALTRQLLNRLTPRSKSGFTVDRYSGGSRETEMKA